MTFCVQRVLRAVVGFVLCSAAFGGTSVQAQDWPQWRGPNRDAKATGFDAPASWPKELTKKWSVTVGDGVATPALVGNKLYVFTRQDGKEIIRCLDAKTGDEAWQHSYEAEQTRGGAGGFPGPRSTPTVADGKVVTFGVDGMLCCYDATSGSELWRNDKYVGSYPMFYTSSSPIVVNGTCIVQQGGRRDGGIVAYDLTTGEEKWKWMESGPTYGSPVLMEVDGVKAVFTPTDSKMVALNAADGKLLWEIPYSQGRYNAATPIVAGTTLIIAGPGTGLTAFGIKKDGDKLVEEKLWSNTDNSIGFNTPVIKDKLMFGLSNANQLFCIDTESKKTAWSAPFAKAAADAQDEAKAKAAQRSPYRVPATLAQFVQQEEEKDRPRERPRGEFDGERRRGEGRGDGRGRFGPGGFGGRGFGRGGGMGGGRGYGSIVDVGPALLGLTPAGELVVYQPDGKAFAELARYKVAERGTYAYPVPSGHGIYVKDQNDLTLWSVE
jgi:outer membrane protein assembly factor BamB